MSTDEQIRTLNAQLAQKDDVIAMLKTKTKDYVQKLKDEHVLNVEKIRTEVCYNMVFLVCK